MLIRCPECFFTRQVNDGKVPVGSEYATCPKCKKRFRFRTLTPEELAEAESAQAARPEESVSSDMGTAESRNAASHDPVEQAWEGRDTGYNETGLSAADHSHAQELTPENAELTQGKDGSEDDLRSIAANLNWQWEEHADTRADGCLGSSGSTEMGADDPKADAANAAHSDKPC